MIEPFKNSWKKAWKYCGVEETDWSLFDMLMAAYSEPHRKYHTLQHLGECLDQLELVWSFAQKPAEIGLALWFHDAIYDPTAQDNERRSADWAFDVIEGTVGRSAADRIREMILATRHIGRPSQPDEQIAVDIDLWILGSPRRRFDEYQEQIRAEYSYVPEAIYRRERRKTLDRFLSRSFVYHTEFFRRTVETIARENLRDAIVDLGGHD